MASSRQGIVETDKTENRIKEEMNDLFKALELHREDKNFLQKLQATYDIKQPHVLDAILMRLKYKKINDDVNQADTIHHWTPLLTAAQAGDVDMVRLLLAMGANVDCVDFLGRTPLEQAAFEGKLKTVKLLVENGANVNHVNSHGETPLLQALQYCNHQVVEFLLESGADANHFDHKGESPLIVTAINGYKDTFNLLVKYGADVKLVTTGYRSAIKTAINCRQISIVACLIQNGLPVDYLMGKHGRTPFSVALKQGKLRIAMLLLENGAKTDIAHLIPECDPVEIAHLIEKMQKCIAERGDRNKFISEVRATVLNGSQCLFAQPRNVAKMNPAPAAAADNSQRNTM